MGRDCGPDNALDGFFLVHLQLPEAPVRAAVHAPRWGLVKVNPNLYENGRSFEFAGDVERAGLGPRESTLQLCPSKASIGTSYYEPGHGGTPTLWKENSKLDCTTGARLCLQATRRAADAPRPFRERRGGALREVGPALLELEAAGGGGSHSDVRRRVLRRLAPRFAEAAVEKGAGAEERDEVDDA